MNEAKQVEQWRSQCPVARTLDLIGDRWSLLIVRDMLSGSSKFQQFLASPENIPTNVLSSRLKLLESSGLIKATLPTAPSALRVHVDRQRQKTRFGNSGHRRLGRIQYSKPQGKESDLFDPGVSRPGFWKCGHGISGGARCPSFAASTDRCFE
jgi:hypothetical protein